MKPYDKGWYDGYNRLPCKSPYGPGPDTDEYNEGYADGKEEREEA